jgi:hypothetical protein
MSAKLEAFLAKLYVDAEIRDRFLADPRGEAAMHGFDEQEAEALASIDRIGLKMAALSLSRKARAKSRKP